MKTLLVATIPFALVFALPAPASAAKGAASSSALNSSDRKFLGEAAGGGLAEVELGRLAVEKASDPDVKAFGQHMVDDHSKVNEELKKLADSKGVTVPSKLPAKEAQLQKKLSALSGRAFDRAYVDAMVKDHEHDVAAFQKQSTAAHDPDVAAFATKTLPTLREHLTRVQGISKSMKGKSADAASKGM